MKITIKNVRLSFSAIFAAKSVNGSDPAFSASFIFPKDHPQIKEIEATIRQAAEEKWGAKAPEVLKTLKAGDKMCLHNGDSKSEYDGYEGNLYISARNKTRPRVVDANKQDLSQADGKPYDGCFVNSSLEIWAQDNQFGKRINASLRGVQFVRDGDAFAGGGVASDDEFEDLGDGSDAPSDDGESLV